MTAVDVINHAKSRGVTIKPCEVEGCLDAVPADKVTPPLAQLLKAHSKELRKHFGIGEPPSKLKAEAAAFVSEAIAETPRADPPPEPPKREEQGVLPLGWSDVPYREAKRREGHQ
jgi:hypothetical protein